MQQASDSMFCPQCDYHNWRVRNTASSGITDRQRQHLKAMIPAFVTWYTPDFVVRCRLCPQCDYAGVTIEIERKDLVKIVDAVAAHQPDILKTISHASR